MSADLGVRASAPLAGIGGAILALAMLLPFMLYFGTARDIVAIWDRSETFAHGYVILPISLWMIWQRRATVARLPVQPYWPALAALAACGFGWLLAELGEVGTAAQYAFAAMLPLTALAVLGRPIARALAFPLLFVLFAVPFGEIFVPPLINVTADFTVAALRATGIPVLRDGASFTIPSGNWSVVDACSGVRYLISSFTLGTLYAFLTYRSRWRQAAFVLCSIVVPIVANGMRAYMIVMIGHLSGMTLAVGVDHLIYGWVFFGIVMFLLFWIGSFWREDGQQQPAPALPAAPAPGPLPAARLGVAALAVAACIGVWPAWLQHLEHSEHNPARADLARLAPAWESGPAFTAWTASFTPPDARLRRFLRHDAATVGLDVLYYRNQDGTSKLISSSNRLTTGTPGDWHVVDAQTRSETAGGRQLAVRESALSDGTGRLLVWQWYWIDGRRTASDYAGKLLQVHERLFDGSDDGAAILVFAPYDANPEQARAALRAFLGANLGPLEAALAANRGH